MEKTITVQIHDYDISGRYRIVADFKATSKEVVALMSKALKSVNLDWSKLPPNATHVVYYAELVDKNDHVWFSAIYIRGEAYDDKEFDRVFCQPNVGYVGAFHKRV